MKLQNKWLYALLILIGLTTSLITKAQKGTSCDSAKVLTYPINTTVTGYTGGVYWFKVILDAGDFNINVINFPGVGKIIKADVYTGTCTSLSLNRIDSLINTSDTTFNVNISNAVNATTFYVKLYNTGGSATFSKTMATEVHITGQIGFCPGQQAVLLSNPYNINGTPSYTWQPGGAHTNSITVTPSNTVSPTAYTLTYNDNGGTLTTTVNIFPLSPNECKNCEYVQNGHLEWYNKYSLTAYNITDSQFWINANTGTVDYFNTNFPYGISIPSNGPSTNTPSHSGNAYAGFLTYHTSANFREYLQSNLKCALVQGQAYQVSFYAISANKSNRVSNNIGAYLSTTAINNSAPFGAPLSYTPQINRSTILPYSTSWTQISGNITGNNEQYITIGNFYNDANTSLATSTSTSAINTTTNSYYFVDDISITPLTPTLSSSSYTVDCNSAATITLTATGSPSVYTTWTNGTTTYSGSVVSVTTPTANTTYTCVVSLPCSSCIPLTQTITISVIPTLAVTASPTVICSGLNSTLTVSGATTYTWSTGANTTSISVTPTITTIYSVTGTYTGGCTNTKTVSVSVNTTPTVAVSDVSICLGQSTTLTASGANTYSWSTGATSSSISVSPTVTTNYTVTGTSLTGCTNTKTVTVSVNSNPTVTATSSPTAICFGSNSTLIASGAATYSWSTGATTASISVSPTVTTNYSVTGTTSGCTNTKTVSVNVLALPTLTINPSPTAICAGANYTMTASGANTYSWNTGATTTSIVVNPSVTTVYSVTGTSSSGCSNTKSYTVTVNSLPTLTAVSSPTSVCLSSSTLTATGANTYSWSTGATTSTISVSPTVTTVYTVTGTSAAGCVSQKTISVTYGPTSPTISVTSNTNIICNGSTTLTANGGASYTWSPGGATTASIAVSPTVATVYTITSTYGSGCGTYTSTTLVNPQVSTLCCSASNTTIGTSLTSSVNMASGSYTVSGTVIDMQGVISFTETTSFNGYIFRMAPGTKLIMNRDRDLTLTNCKIFSCSNLWDGIYFNQFSGKIGGLYLTNTTIEDMYNGIVMDYQNYSLPSTEPTLGNIVINQSILNKNYTAIQILNSTGKTTAGEPYGLTITSSTISSNTSTTSPGSTLKPSNTYTYAYNQITNGSDGTSAPYLNFPRAYTGIYFNNLGTTSPLVIGDYTTAGNTNTFDNMDFGIRGGDAYMKVFNNYFKNITGSVKQIDPSFIDPLPPAPGPDEIGIAVMAMHTAPNLYDLFVGNNTVLPSSGNPFPRGNLFENTNKGIKADNCNHVYAKANVFTATTTSTLVGSPTVLNPNTYYYYQAQNCMWITGSTTGNELYYNYIRNHSSGIYLASVASSTAGGLELKIESNDIAAPSATGYCKSAIQIEQLAGTVDAVFIYDNTIDEVYNGIIVNGVKTDLEILSNPRIKIESTAKTYGASATYQRSAIKLSNCEYGIIRNNAVSSNAATTPTSNTTASYNNGIYLVNSKNGNIECNSASNLGRGFTFEGTCVPNTWLTNSMSNSYTGLEIRTNGKIGTQGAISGSPNLSANTWTTITQETNVLSSPGTNSLSVLYLKANITGLKTQPTLNFGTATQTYTTGVSGGIQVITGTSYTCNASGVAQRMNHSNNGSNQKQIADDNDSLALYTSLATNDANAYDVFTDEFMYQDKQLVYKLLKEDSLDAPEGSALDSFYIANQNTVINQLTEAQQAIAGNDLNTAIAKNNAVTATNTVEQKHQRANELLLKYLANHSYNYSTEEKQDLYAMANECLVKGYYVIQCRNLLNLISDQIISYEDNCDTEANNSRKTKVSTVSFATSFLLSPNPNNGTMKLDYDLGKDQEAIINLLDVTGKLVRSYKLANTKGTLEMNEQGLQNGIYFYRILVDNKTIKTDKIVIIK